MFSSPTNNGFNGFLPPMAQGFGFRAPILGPNFGRAPIVGHPVAAPQPANFPGVPFGGPAPVRVFSPMPANFHGGPFGGPPPQANFQPEPEMRIINGLVARRVPNVRADLGYQQPNVGNPAPVYLPAPQPNYLLQPIPNASPAGGFSPPPAFQSPMGSPQPSVQARAMPQLQGPLDSDETQRKNLYSLSCFSSSDPLAQNASTQIANRRSDTSRIFHEYRSASGGRVSPADFIANFYGNGNSNSVGSPLVKICTMELAETIRIGECEINGRRNYIDINEGGNKTRIHIDDEGAKDLENYRILVRGELEKLRNNIDFKSLNQVEFKNLKNVSDIVNQIQQQPIGVQVTNDNKTLDAFADTFISNNLKLGIFKTEILNSQGVLQDKDFAYVKIERPKGDDKKINVTVSDKYSEELNSININAGKNSNNEEVFFQLSVKAKDGKQVIAQDSLKYFTKNGNGQFEPEEDVKKGWFGRLKNKGKLGDAKDKTINIYTHKEKEEDETLKYVIKGGKFVEGYTGYTYDSTLPDVHKHQKVKCGELNDFTDHEFMNAQSRSVFPQAGARGGPQSPDQVARGGMAVGQSVVSSPIPQPPIQYSRRSGHAGSPPAPMPMMGGGAPMSPQPIPYQRQFRAPAPAPIVDMRPPTPSEVRRWANPHLQIVVRQGDGGVAHGAVQARTVPPMVMMPAGAPNFHCNPLAGRPMQQIHAEHGPFCGAA